MTSQTRISYGHGLNQSTQNPHSKQFDFPELIDDIVQTGVMRNDASNYPNTHHVVINCETSQRAVVTLPSMHPKTTQCIVTQPPQNRLPSMDITPKTQQPAVRESVLDAEGPEWEIREQQSKARRREQARRHLSKSLSGPTTLLPVLRRTQSFSVAAHVSRQHVMVRQTGSLGHKPAPDGSAQGASLRRTRSLREDGNPTQPLSMSLPQPSRQISLAALVHELNAGVHYPVQLRQSRDLFFSDDLDDSVSNDLGLHEDIIDPDLFPWRARAVVSDVTSRTLTPALRKLNRRRVSSRVRTQQWVNQIEGKAGHENKNETRTVMDKTRVALIFEQEI